MSGETHGAGEGAANLRGAGLMMLSMACFVFNDTALKSAGAILPLPQILVLRGLVATVLMYVVARRMGTLRLDLPTREWRLIGLRSLADLGTNYTFLTALLHMPLGNVTAIVQVVPLTLTLAAAVFFREPLGWRRLAAIAVGFVGVLLIVRPGAAGFDAWSLWALAAVGFVTLRDLAARRLARDTPTATVALVGAVTIMLAAGVQSLFQGWQPMTAPSAGLVLLAGVFVTGGYVTSVAAMRVGDVGFVSPFRYTGLVWALLLGFVVFGDWPGPVTLAGAGIVVATGLFTIHRERQLALARRTPATGP